VEIGQNSSTECACMVRARWLALAPYASILPLRSVKGRCAQASPALDPRYGSSPREPPEGPGR
jgi:hypothetical protein